MVGEKSTDIKDGSWGNLMLSKILHTDESHVIILAQKGKMQKGLWA